MSSQKTTNYDLNQWLPADSVLRTDFNADNAKIDAALKTNADAVAALQIAVSKCGTCKFECFSYNGTGADTTTISFAHKPVLFLIQGYNGMLLSIVQSEKTISFIQGTNVYFDDSALAWNGTQAVISGMNASYQMNTSGKRYWVFALYQEV